MKGLRPRWSMWPPTRRADGCAVGQQTVRTGIKREKGIEVPLRNEGFCPVCEKQVEFVSADPWLRDHYRCCECGSIPRERALMVCIEMFYPQWRSLTIHESSPTWRGASLKLRRECADYVPTYYYPCFPPGRIHPSGFRCENLEEQTFESEIFDLVVTQDVMEHVLDPARAFTEIARTLRPGGAHIFTTPLVNKSSPSQLRATRGKDGSVAYLYPPEYHSNPVDSDGSLVCVHWGYDITEFILAASNLHTAIVIIDDTARGIRAEYIEVLVSRKPEASDAVPLSWSAPPEF